MGCFRLLVKEYAGNSDGILIHVLDMYPGLRGLRKLFI